MQQFNLFCGGGECFGMQEYIQGRVHAQFEDVKWPSSYFPVDADLLTVVNITGSWGEDDIRQVMHLEGWCFWDAWNTLYKAVCKFLSSEMVIFLLYGTWRHMI